MRNHDNKEHLHRHATHGSFLRQEKRVLQKIQAREEM
jgi:hypothetical protein